MVGVRIAFVIPTLRLPVPSFLCSSLSFFPLLVIILVALLVFPEVIVPGFVHDTHLLHKNHDNLWPILRVFALQVSTNYY